MIVIADFSWLRGQCSSTNARKNLEAFLRKVPVERQGFANAFPVHEFEADAVHKTDATLVCSSQPLHAPSMKLFRNPVHLKQRKDVCVQISDRVKSKPMLK